MGNSRLTKRELEAAQLVAEGKSNAEIAKVLGIQVQSTKNMICKIMRVVGCANRVQLALWVLGQRELARG